MVQSKGIGMRQGSGQDHLPRDDSAATAAMRASAGSLGSKVSRHGPEQSLIDLLLSRELGSSSGKSQENQARQRTAS